MRNDAALWALLLGLCVLAASACSRVVVLGDLADSSALPKPVELTRIEGCSAMSLALNRGLIYFTDAAHGSVGSIAASGGNLVSIATNQATPLAIAVDDQGVYWSTSGPNASDNAIVMKQGSDAATTITAVNVAPARIAADGNGALYYGDGDDLMKVETNASSTPLRVGTFDGRPAALLLTPPPPQAPTRIYANLSVVDSVQWRSPDPASSGCLDPVARPVGSSVGGCEFEQSQSGLLLEALSMSKTNLLWARSSFIQRADTAIPATEQGDGHVVVSSAGLDDISGFISNATTVYFGEATTGLVEKAAISSASRTMPLVLVDDLASEQDPASFLIDASNVYWRAKDAATGACSIMRLAQ
jgi:hypothetical protein